MVDIVFVSKYNFLVKLNVNMFMKEKEKKIPKQTMITNTKLRNDQEEKGKLGCVRNYRGVKLRY